MKAINTHYKDYYFRSRLEARWAVFFETLGVKFEYEPEGYSFDGFKYLPDFYFPDYDFFGEVKPANFGDKDLERWTIFAEQIKKPLIIFEGTPHAKPSRAFYYDGLIFTDYHTLIPFADKIKLSYGCFWYCNGHEDFAPYFREAIKAAKSERFNITDFKL